MTTALYIDSPLKIQLKYLYPFENEQAIELRKTKILDENKQEELKTKLQNVNKFISLGYLHYNCLDSILQQIIRNNTKPSVSNFDSALDFFEYLADKINDKQIILLIDKEILSFLYQNPLETELIDLDGCKKIKILYEKYPSFKCSSLIQKNLIIPFYFSSKQSNSHYLHRTIKQKVSFLVDLDLSIFEFQKKFFNHYFLNKLIEDSSIEDLKDRFSLQGLEFLYKIYKIIGEDNLSVLNDPDVQEKILFIENDFDQHNNYIQELNLNLLTFFTRMSEIDISDKNDFYLDMSILRNLLSDFDFDWSESAKYLDKLKKKFPKCKLTKKLIWFVVRPTILDKNCSKNTNLIHSNIETFLNTVSLLSIDEYYSLLNLDLIESIIECSHLLKKETINSVYKLNKIFIDKGDILANRKMIHDLFQNNIEDILLDADTIVETEIKQSNLLNKLAQLFPKDKSISDLLPTKKLHYKTDKIPTSYSESYALNNNAINFDHETFYKATRKDFEKRLVESEKYKHEIELPIEIEKSFKEAIQDSQEKISLEIPIEIEHEFKNNNLPDKNANRCLTVFQFLFLSFFIILIVFYYFGS